MTAPQDDPKLLGVDDVLTPDTPPQAFVETIRAAACGASGLRCVLVDALEQRRPHLAALPHAVPGGRFTALPGIGPAMLGPGSRPAPRPGTPAPASFPIVDLRHGRGGGAHDLPAAPRLHVPRSALGRARLVTVDAA